MNLDLSALDDDTPVIDGAGTVKRAPLDQFEPDPVQLARERDEAADTRDRDNIKRFGVMQPIVVAAEPTPEGKLRIKTGHRRWRLSGEAGLPDVPYIHAIPGVVYDDYAQLAENRNRQNESPMDIAKHIVAAKARGEKNKFIADQIGIDPAEVTHHLVLIEGPEYVRSLYETRKCRTPKYLYELTNLAKDYPAQVEEFCATSEDFSRKAISAFADSLKNPQKPAATPSQAENGTGPDLGLGNTKEPTELAPLADVGPILGNTKDLQVGAPATPPPGSDADQDIDAKAGSDESGELDVPGVKATHIPSHNPDNEKDAAGPYLADPSKIKKPLMLGTYGKDDVMVMLYKRPTTPGLVFVKYENGNGEVEVEFGKLKNLTLTESKV